MKREHAPHLAAKDRTEQLLEAALAVAERDGFSNLRRDAIAAKAGVNGSLVSLRLGTMDAVRRAVMRRAIKERRLSIVAQGLAIKDRHALKAPQDLREKAIASLLGV